MNLYHLFFDILTGSWGSDLEGHTGRTLYVYHVVTDKVSYRGISFLKIELVLGE